MEHSDAVLPRRRRRSDIGRGAFPATEPGDAQQRPRRIPYGLCLLFLALIAGLAAALVLTIGNAHAAAWLLGAIAAL